MEECSRPPTPILGPPFITALHCIQNVHSSVQNRSSSLPAPNTTKIWPKFPSFAIHSSIFPYGPFILYIPFSQNSHCLSELNELNEFWLKMEQEITDQILMELNDSMMRGTNENGNLMELFCNFTKKFIIKQTPQTINPLIPFHHLLFPILDCPSSKWPLGKINQSRRLDSFHREGNEGFWIFGDEESHRGGEGILSKSFSAYPSSHSFV